MYDRSVECGTVLHRPHGGNWVRPVHHYNDRINQVESLIKARGVGVAHYHISKLLHFVAQTCRSLQARDSSSI